MLEAVAKLKEAGIDKPWFEAQLLLGWVLGKDQAAHKLTYVSLYGLEAARRVAADTARRAKEALAIFGQAAEYFIELTEATLQRDH